MKHSITAFLLALATLPSCSISFPSLSGQGTSSSGQGTSVSYTHVSAETPFDENVALPYSEEALALFAPTSRSSVALKLTPEVAEFINKYQTDRDQNKYFDAYLPADFELTLNGKSYAVSDVGVRLKGNMSRDTFMQNGKITNPVHWKVKFDATFDSSLYSDPLLAPFKHDWTGDAEGRKARKDRTFLDFQKIDLKFVPRNDDSCIAREIYAYSAFANHGLLAPKANLGTMDLVIGEEKETFDIEFVECVDKTFLKRHFSKAEAKGDLYKCVYNKMGKADLSRDGAVEKTVDESGRTIGTRVAKGKIGVEDNYINYVPCYQLKTNDNDEDSDFSSMSNYIASVWNILYKGGSKEELESLLDVPEFLSFSAISYLMGNFDDQRYNDNNYYLYFLPSNGKAIYIPYDWDWCLGIDQGRGIANSKPFDAKTIDGSDQSNIFYATFLKASKGSLGYDRAEYQNAYAGLCSSLAPTVLNENAFKDLVKQLGCPETEIEGVAEYMKTKRSVL